MGTQITFEDNLEKWRNSIGLPLTNVIEANRNRTCSPFDNISSPSTSYSASRECSPVPSVSFQTSNSPDQYISLGNILSESSKGLMLTEYFNKFKKFQEDQRILLIALIASYYEEKSVQLSLSSSYRIEKEILERFPTEKLEYYRVSKRGKIYNKYCNMKSAFKSAVSSHILAPKPIENKKEIKSRYEKNFDENVFIPVLKVIKQCHIEKLLKNFDMGTQITFEDNLEKWRNSIGLPLTNVIEANRNRTCSPFDNISSPSTSYSASRECSPVPSVSFQTSNSPDQYISLGNILSESSKGLMLTEYFNKFKKFQEDQRILLIALIASYYEEKSVQLSLSSSYRIEKEILERFPTEKLVLLASYKSLNWIIQICLLQEYYRVSKRGKIYNKYCNMKSAFKSAVSSHILAPKPIENKKEIKSRYEKNFEPEQDAESCLRCLKYDNLSAEQFDSCWKACARYRLAQIKEAASTSDIMELWPFYKNPSGYRLIDMDFHIAFDGRDGLLLNWDNYLGNFVKFLSSDGHIKDKKIKAVVEVLKNSEDISESE
ncbi:hypothetical protein FQR65_LT18998 [Abscondita terminalis]|nr:hypothetical protein FQR65_LT18998 [Abscondita terminalis]